MALNYLFVVFFLVAFAVCLLKALVMGEVGIMEDAVNSTFDNAKLGFELALGYTGAMTLWLGLMKVAEEGGVVKTLSRGISPLFSKLFPDVPKDHPATGSMIMNIAANMMGLDNAATPLGLKAMNDLQSLNPTPEKATNAQIMFLVLNTSGLTIIPISIMAFIALEDNGNPTSVFLPILLTTFFSTMAGIMVVALMQRIPLYRYRAVWAYLGGATLLISSLIWGMFQLSQADQSTVSSFAGNFIIFGLMVWFIGAAFYRKVNVYEAFIDGAKEGFTIAIKIIPYLVAMLVAIGLFRVSGTLEYLTDGIAWGLAKLDINSDFVPALPTAFMKPLSGSGARGMMLETFNHFGVNAFPSRVAAVMQGSTETTFYVLAVYFGAVGIKNTRYAVGCGLFADFVGIIAAILLSYVFFH